MNPTRMAKYRKAKSLGRPRLITEGDSWFNYPVEVGIPGYERDITEWLAIKHHYAVLGFERFGAELIDMVADQEFAPYLKKERPRALLFSGGGNDILGDPLKRLVRPRNGGPIEDCVDWDLLNTEVIPGIEKAYETLLQLVDLLRPGLPVITHGYAYPVPSGTAAHVFWKKVAGPWIKPTLDDKGLTTGEQRKVLVFLIDALNEMQQRMAARHPGTFLHVDLRSLIKDDDWRDEIHLTASAYKKAALKFHAAIKNA